MSSTIISPVNSIAVPSLSHSHKIRVSTKSPTLRQICISPSFNSNSYLRTADVKLAAKRSVSSHLGSSHDKDSPGDAHSRFFLKTPAFKRAPTLPASTSPHPRKDDSQISNVDEVSDSVSRRRALVFASVSLGFNQSPSESVANAEEVSKLVKLKNVEDRALQDALRAAVAGELERAESMFVRFVADDPDNASLWSNLGSIRVSLEKYEEATSDLTRAIELAPFAPVPYLNRAIAYEALGYFDKASSDCKRAIENDPQEYAAWFNLGNIESDLKNYENSLIAYERASLLAPGIAGYRLKQALTLFQIGRIEEAIKLTSSLVRKYPNYSEAHAFLAAMFWTQQKNSMAEEQYSQAILNNPQFNNRDLVRDRINWPPRAKEAFENFLQVL